MTTAAATTNVYSEELAIILRSLEENVSGLLSRIPHLVVGLLVVVIVALVARVGVGLFLGPLLQRTRLRPSLKILFASLSRISIWVVGLLTAAIVVFPGLSVSKALGAAGLASIAIGFAFKDIFQNFFAGILILWRFPFEPGDFIECGEFRGRVVDTELRLTTIRQSDGELLIVPNSHLLTNPVRVVTDQELRRTCLTVGISYRDDLRSATRILKNTLRKCSTVSDQHPQKVLPCCFNASSVDIELLYWTDSAPLRERESHAEVITSVKKALEDAGITIPYPQRVVTVATSDGSHPLGVHDERAVNFS